MTEDNRIPEIRAYHHRLSGLTADGVGSWCSCGLEECAVLWLLDHIDNLTPPAPRVFFPGDPIPPGTVAVARSGHPYENLFADESTTCGLPLVEVAIPSPEEWQAAVDQARAEREEALRADRHAEITEAEASEARDG